MNSIYNNFLLELKATDMVSTRPDSSENFKFSTPVNVGIVYQNNPNEMFYEISLMQS